MDGVLVEVMDSYREAIRETVRHFTGQLVSHDVIQDFKNAGGWNNDWLLSQRLISDFGKNVEYADVVEYFNQIFLGENGDGLIRRESWMPANRISRALGRALFACNLHGPREIRSGCDAAAVRERHSRSTR